MHYSLHCKIKGIEHLTAFELMIILSLLLLCSGDIELNPCPSTSLVDSESLDESLILNYFSVVHYNIQSISNKVDLIGSELRNFNIICLTETWLSHSTSDDSLKIDEFKLYRSDQQADNYGGVCVYIKENVHSRRRTDLEILNIECIWVEVNIHHRIFILGTFYRPPNSSVQTLSYIEDSVSLAFDSNIKDVFITGDFNLDTLKATTNKQMQHVSIF